VKCYKNALRYSVDNLQILRDLATLQAQIRDLQGHVETRRKLLQLKPTIMLHWYQLAAAEHMAGNPDAALRVLAEAINKKREEFTEQQQQAKPPRNARELQERQNQWLDMRHELGELHVYRAQLLELVSGPKAALDYIEANARELPDKLGMRERRAELLLKLGDLPAAQDAYRELLRINPEHAGYHAALVSALGIAAQPQKLAEHYDVLCAANPKSVLLKALHLRALADCGGEDASAFAAKLKTLLQDSFRRGVPSMFQALKSVLYRTPATSAATGSVADEIVAEAEKSSSVPTYLLWALHFAAQHATHVGDTDKALGLIERAREHTPTCIDVYTARARVLRHAGDVAGAADAYDMARRLDLADRYLNTRAVRYMLRADRPEDAFKTVALFLRDGAASQGAQAMLADMQVCWFEYEAGMCFLRMGDHGHALKMFLSIEKHYNDFLEDQFDFHYFCFRKCTVSEYIRLIRLEDSILASRVFVRAALAAISTYFALVDMRKAGISPKPVPAIVAATAIPSETAEQQQHAKKKQPGKKETEPKEKDTDPNGEQLAQVEDPLKEAERLVLRLLGARPEMPAAVHIAACELYLRRDKLALAVKHLALAKKAAGSEEAEEDELPNVLRMTALVHHAVGAAQGTPAVAEINKDELAAVELADPITLLQRHAESLGCVAELCDAANTAFPEQLQQCFAALSAAIGSVAPKQDHLAVVERAHRVVQGAKGLNPEQKEQFRLACRKLFPLATHLKNEKELADEAAAAKSAATAAPSKPEHTSP